MGRTKEIGQGQEQHKQAALCPEEWKMEFDKGDVTVRFSKTASEGVPDIIRGILTDSYRARVMSEAEGE